MARLLWQRPSLDKERYHVSKDKRSGTRSLTPAQAAQLAIDGWSVTLLSQGPGSPKLLGQDEMAKRYLAGASKGFVDTTGVMRYFHRGYAGKKHVRGMSSLATHMVIRNKKADGSHTDIRVPRETVTIK